MKRQLTGQRRLYKLNGIKPDTSNDSEYFYIITSNNTKPSIPTKSDGSLDVEQENGKLERFSKNAEESCIYSYDFTKYVELNQDIYIWILQQSHLEDSYYDNNGNYIAYATRFVVEGKKIQRAELPKLNLILQTFSMGNKGDVYTSIDFNFPTETKNRKFKIKIGMVTDNSILSKLQNNDGAGLTELLNYAKNDDSIYSQDLSTTEKAIFQSDETLFDGSKLLQDGKYYYIYVQFDDENGKYYPIEGVNICRADVDYDGWWMYAWTSNEFEWSGLSANTQDNQQGDSSTATSNMGNNDGSSENDDTVASENLPQTGVGYVIIAIMIVMILLSIIFHARYNRFKDIK